MHSPNSVRTLERREVDNSDRSTKQLLLGVAFKASAPDLSASALYGGSVYVSHAVTPCQEFQVGQLSFVLVLQVTEQGLTEQSTEALGVFFQKDTGPSRSSGLSASSSL